MLHFGDRKWGPKVQVPIVQNGWGSGAKFLWGLVSNALKSSMTPITQFLIPYPITTKYSTVGWECTVNHLGPNAWTGV